MRPLSSDRKMLIYTILLQFVTILAIVGLGIGYVQAQTRKICGLIILIDQPAPTPSTSPSTNPRAQQFADKIHEYRESIGCKESK